MKSSNFFLATLFTLQIACIVVTETILLRRHMDLLLILGQVGTLDRYYVSDHITPIMETGSEMKYLNTSIACTILSRVAIMLTYFWFFPGHSVMIRRWPFQVFFVFYWFNRVGQLLQI